jgi:hypothetical protein
MVLEGASIHSLENFTFYIWLADWNNVWEIQFWRCVHPDSGSLDLVRTRYRVQILKCCSALCWYPRVLGDNEGTSFHPFFSYSWAMSSLFWVLYLLGFLMLVSWGFVGWRNKVASFSVYSWALSSLFWVLYLCGFYWSIIFWRGILCLQSREEAGRWDFRCW